MTAPPRPREPRFYWVKLPKSGSDEWLIAHWEHGYWMFGMSDFDDSDAAEIDEHRIEHATLSARSHLEARVIEAALEYRPAAGIDAFYAREYLFCAGDDLLACDAHLAGKEE